MKRVAVRGLAFSFAILCTVSVKAQDASQADKDHALRYLESTKQGVLDATKGCPTLSGTSSRPRTAGHLAATEAVLRGMTQEQAMKSPAVAPRDAVELKKIDEQVVAMIPDRSIQAPEPLKPTNRFGSPADSQKHFVESRATTEEYLKSTLSLRAHMVDSPHGCEARRRRVDAPNRRSQRAAHETDARSESRS
jgi:hypothetical protein